MKKIVMMKKMVLLSFVLLLFLSCSGGEEDEPRQPPLFKSSIPENAALDVPVTSVVEVVFDEVITLAPNPGITINNEAAVVKASLTRLIFEVELAMNTVYNIHIPSGAVINTFGVKLEEDIAFSFKTEVPVEIHPSETLVSANASAEAQNVYAFLLDGYGSKCISAVQSNVSWNINEAEWVKLHTGKYPAMATMDYIHLPYVSEGWIDYSQTAFIEDWWDNKGLIAASWHWLVPPYEGAPLSYDYTYKPGETTFKASNILIEGTWEHSYAVADLEKLAGYLKLLKDKNIPVLWRPLHEASGNVNIGGKAWFWWGYSGADTYKALWQMMFNYFADQGLNNLIWVWTTQTGDEDYYPGDAYVDIIGRDIYNEGDALAIASQFKTIQEAYPNKMVTLSEMGSVARISEQWSNGAAWSYFMPWYDYERTNDVNSAEFESTEHGHANAAWWQDAMDQGYVISRDQMPDLK